jgi:hypothetical protein
LLMVMIDRLTIFSNKSRVSTFELGPTTSIHCQDRPTLNLGIAARGLCAVSH